MSVLTSWAFGFLPQMKPMFEIKTWNNGSLIFFFFFLGNLSNHGWDDQIEDLDTLSPKFNAQTCCTTDCPGRHSFHSNSYSCYLACLLLLHGNVWIWNDLVWMGYEAWNTMRETPSDNSLVQWCGIWRIKRAAMLSGWVGVDKRVHWCI